MKVYVVACLLAVFWQAYGEYCAVHFRMYADTCPANLVANVVECLHLQCCTGGG